MKQKIGILKTIGIITGCMLMTACKLDKSPPVSTAIVKGDSITFIPFAGGVDTSLPHLFADHGEMLLSWVKKIDDNTSQLNYSRLNNHSWEQAAEIVAGNDWFVNWADFPAIVANRGNLLAHNLTKTAKETFSYDIELNLLPKGATQWKTQLPLHTDGTLSEHGFVTMQPYKEDSFFITWLDGRNMVSGKDHGTSSGEMTIRAAEVAFDGTVRNSTPIDEQICTCCQTTAAITANGPVVLYRDKTDDEIRDISITRQVDGKWTRPKPIFNDGWEIKGCPVNGPKIAAMGNDLAVAWFTAANDIATVKVAFSNTGGEAFGQPVIISSGVPLGRVDIALINKHTAVVSYMEYTDNSTYLKARKVDSTGAKYTPITITKIDGARKTGFPQMELLDDNLYFAWTTTENTSTTILTGYLNVSAF